MGPEAKIPAAVMAVINTLRAISPTTVVFIIGGAICDIFTSQRTPSDWDLEVHGATEEAVLSSLSSFSPHKVGSKHPAIRFNADGVPVDVSVPPHGPEEASRLRDFTINSPYWDAISGDLFDPHDGLGDGKNLFLDMTSEEGFMKDPVNVLRAAQFLAREKARTFNMNLPVASALQAAFADKIPIEQVFSNLRKLMSGVKPSRGLQFLRLAGWHKIVLPEVAALDGCPEHPEWHPEGDSWEHTLRVVDNAALLKEHIPSEWQEAFMWGALLHDVGKALTNDGTGEHKGHDQAGEAPARSLLERLKAGKDFSEKVIALVTNHMQPFFLTNGNAGDAAWRRLHNKVPLTVIAWQSRADWAAHPDHALMDPEHKPSKAALEAASRLPAAKIPAVVQGRDLVAAGVKPGPHMKVGLDAAYAAQIEKPDTDKLKLVEIALLAISQS